MPIVLLRTSFFTNTATYSILHSSLPNQHIHQTWTQTNGRPKRPLNLNAQKCLAYQKVPPLCRNQEQPKTTHSNSQRNRRQHNQTSTHATRYRISICFLFSAKSRLRFRADTLHERNQARGKIAPPGRQARPADYYDPCAKKQAQEAPR